jgi:hypothetical protein
VPKDRSVPADADLDKMQWVADPHADEAVAALRPGIRTLIAGWGKDSEASGWMNALEDSVTTHGDWEALEYHAPR